MFCSRPKCFCPWDSIWIVTLLHQDIVQVKYWIKCMSLFPVCYIFNIINIYTINKIKYCSCSNAFVSSHGSEFPAREKKKKNFTHRKSFQLIFPQHWGSFSLHLFSCNPFPRQGNKAFAGRAGSDKTPFTVSSFSTKLNFFSRSCQSHSPSANRHNMTLPMLGEKALKRNTIGSISH